MSEKLSVKAAPALDAGVPAPEPSDDAIVERVRNGDVNAFELLMRRYDRWVFGIVARRAPREQVADLAQEAFVHAYQALPNYRANPSADGFRHWLAKIARRRCCDYWRALSRHPTCAFSNLNVEAREQLERNREAAASEVSHSEMERDTARELVCEAMDRLETDDRTILWLLYWRGYSTRETAALLGYSTGNVKIRASRARSLVRRRMGSSADPPAPTLQRSGSMCNPGVNHAGKPNREPLNHARFSRESPLVSA